MSQQALKLVISPMRSSSFLVRAPIGLPSQAPKRVKLAWTPNPGPQVSFLACPATEVLYGGMLGGGKTDALLADFTSQVHVPGYSGLFIRKSYPELLQVIRRSHRIYPALGGRYHKTEKVWTFPSGATLRFGYVTSYEDALRYASDEYQWIAIDECTHIPFDAFELLSTRLRGAASLGLSCYIRLSANPNGKHMLWVRQRFIEGKAPMKEYLDEDTGVTRAFIPADMSKTPQLAGTGYAERLKGLGEAERKALLEGDWYAYEGSVFNLERGIHIWTWQQFNEHHALENEHRNKPPRDWTRFRSLDWGFAHPFACYWYAVDYEGRAWVYREWYGVAKDDKGKVQANVGARLEPATVAEKMARIEKEAGERIAVGWTGPDLGSKVRADQGSGRTIESHFADHGVLWSYWTASPGSRLAGKMALHQRLRYERDPETGDIKEWPGIIFIDEETTHAQRTIPSLEYDQHQPEQVDTDGEDHAYDSISGFCKMKPWQPIKREESEHARLRRLAQKSKGGPAWMRR